MLECRAENHVVLTCGVQGYIKQSSKTRSGKVELVQLLDKASILYIVIHIQDRRG